MTQTPDQRTILERLRAAITTHYNDDRSIVGGFRRSRFFERNNAMLDAADEIERLQLELATRTITPAEAAQVPEVKALIEALRWYGEQARLCRLIHYEGDTGRHNLQSDGGDKANTALRALTEGAKP